MPFDVQQPHQFEHLTTQPISGGVGASIAGVDLAADLPDEVIAEVRGALVKHGVIFFRDQELSPEQLIATGRRFGPLNIHPIYLPLDGYPEIMPVVKEVDAVMNIGNSWHSDVSFLEKPSMGSLLYALDVPPYGGDTIFASQRLAYDGLSAEMQSMLSGMKAVHSDRILSSAASKKKRNAGRSTKLDEQETPEVQNVHPVIRTHGESGKKHLYVNEAFTIAFDGMTEAESKPLLDYLYQHARKPEFTCRFRWEKGSVAFWDNRAVQHYALNDYQGFRREMWRVTVEGERPV
jgi:taurine dioxygenase